MLIGDRIRAIREAVGLSQGDIEGRCGLLRVYISRGENGHLVASIENLEKFTHALGIPLYHLFYEAKKRPRPPRLPKRKRAAEIAWGTTRKQIHVWQELRGLLARMSESDRRLLLHRARKMAGRQAVRASFRLWPPREWTMFERL
jgi:transcriptional regulator with XRE-family HTH domain